MALYNRSATCKPPPRTARPPTNHLQVQFTASFPAGFTYVVVPDPGNGQFTLVSVQ